MVGFTEKLNGVRYPFLQWFLIVRLVGGILPKVERELEVWKRFLQQCPSSFLQEQALLSINNKRFHCQGGAAYALLNPTAGRDIISFVTAFQTISDYLDNLCDRLPAWAAAPEDMEAAFRSLHGAMHLALRTEEMKKEPDYYRFYPYRQDGGYLHFLVQRCQTSLARLSNYASIQPKTRFLTRLYSELQVLKHLSFERREKGLKEWFRRYQHRYLYLNWNEFAAAAGSTLGIFALLAAASRPDWRQNKAPLLFHLYFPWVCGLHILLDYFIDQAEDRREGDLNFVSYYENTEQCLQRIRFFVDQAMRQASTVPQGNFHRVIIKGLLALYLSDAKIREQGLEEQARALLAATGENDIFSLYHTCRLLRRCGVL